jgi:hypothetical protein
LIKTGKVILVILITTGLSATGYCQDSAGREQGEVIQGTVVALDWVGSAMTVRWVQPYNNHYDEMTFFMPDNVKITKGTEQIAFSDINEGDKVTVYYYNASPGPLTAINVLVYI